MTQIKNYKMYVDGKWIESSSGKKIETLNPENNKVWATVPEANEKDVDLAVNAAQKAFENSWSKMHPRDRAKYLRELANQLRQNAKHLGKIETIDTGKLFRETKTQANYIAEYYDYFAGLADKVEGTVVPIDKDNMRNTVVIKASELAPVTLLEFAKLVENSGIPKGVVNVITGLGEPCGKSLTTHNLVERIAFTGGPDTAKHIIKNSAENLSQVSLELGGKSPVVVFKDADQENALNGITAGIFGASGQSCIAGSRLYLQNDIYDDFLNKLIKKAEKIKLGSPMDKDAQMGPLNSFKQLEIIEKNIKATIDQGGKLRCGGKRSKISNEGYYFPPTIIECQNHNLPTAENELFGPVLSVMKFNTEEEAINKMNDNKYGLSSGVYTMNFARAMRVSKSVRAGIVFVNTYRLISPMAPFGGIKDSGYGKEAGIESIKEYTRIKTTWYNSSEKPMSDPFTMG